MSAIAERIDFHLSQLPAAQAAKLEHLLVELLTFAGQEVGGTTPQGDDRRVNALAALNRIASRGGIAGISDPSTWQNEQRAERVLPGRDS